MENYIPFVLIPIMGWGVWRYLKKKNDCTSLKKRTFIVAIVSFSITELGRSFYRPYVYENNIKDYFIADTIGNSFGTIAAIFMIITMSGSGRSRGWKIIGIITIGLLGYEFLNLFKGNSIDIPDLLATVVAAIFSSVLYAKFIQQNRPSSDVE